MIYLFILILIAGMCAGLSDRSKFHPDTLPSYLQGRSWWNTGLIPSWKLKYKDNSRSLGPKFPLSTSIQRVGSDIGILLNELACILYDCHIDSLVLGDRTDDIQIRISHYLQIKLLHEL